MPGLINNLHPFYSTSTAGERGGFPKPFSDRLAEEAVVPLPALLPPPAAGGNAVRVFPMQASQAIGLQPRPSIVAEVAKARVCGNQGFAIERIMPDYGSSGSDHDPSSVCLVAMVNDFMENEGACEESSCTHRFADGGCPSSSRGDLKSSGAAEIHQALQSLASCTSDAEIMLQRDVQLIVDSITAETRHVCDDGSNATLTHGCLKRTVMIRLQKMGYNAAVCKTRWDHSCGIPAGDYEYIDVLLEDDASKRPERLLVDIDFPAQFEIARPTSEFSAVWQLLPPIFVGRSERLQQIVHLMSEATRQSMRLKGLHLPPWRKPSYMNAKWFSPYKRTSNSNSAHPCREGECPGNGGGFAGIAVRGCGLDTRYTNELEMLYHDAGSKIWARDKKGEASLRSERDEITVVVTDWQPPAVVPRSAAATSRRKGEVIGLASLLLQAA